MIIPAMGIAAAGLAGILGSTIGAALAMGVAGAAVAAAIRALARGLPWVPCTLRRMKARTIR